MHIAILNLYTSFFQSHMNKKAEWIGSCSSDFQWNSSNILDSTSVSENKNSNVENSSYHLHMSPKSKNYMQDAHVL